jgi:hypothetical protein
MTVTRNTVAKGGGAVGIRRITDDRILYLNTNSKYTLTKATTDGNKVQGFTSDGSLLDLDVAGQEETYTLEIASKKNTRNINEMAFDSAYVTKATFNAPWVESATVASGTVTLNGGTPVSTTLVCSYIDGSKLASTGSAPSAGQFKDNGDGTVTFNAADNGKVVILFYKTTVSNVYTQGGADHTAVGYVDVLFHQVSGSSTVSNKKSADIIWLPKCSISGEASFEYSNDVQDKSFKLTGLIPDTPSGFLKPYVIIRDVEINNTNAG